MTVEICFVVVESEVVWLNNYTLNTQIQVVTWFKDHGIYEYLITCML